MKQLVRLIMMFVMILGAASIMKPRDRVEELERKLVGAQQTIDRLTKIVRCNIVIYFSIRG
jgi:hypothetical protein